MEGFEEYKNLVASTLCVVFNEEDIMERLKMDAMEHCMNHCSRYWGGSEFCSGVVWRESDKTCWLRNSTTGTADLEAAEGIHVALTNSEDTKPLPRECPGDNLSTHDIGNGMAYTLHCDKYIDGYDTCWSGYHDCKVGPFEGFYHATSLDECLQFCVKEHPLCRAVYYNPTLEIGYANCWPKTGWPDSGLSNPLAGTFHSATITSIEQIDTNCPEEKIYGDHENSWSIQCGKFNAGSNITSVHAQNLTSCIAACAANDRGCIGVVFDSTLHMGYSNCYLKNTTSVMSDKAEVTYAALVSTLLPSTSPSGTATPGNGSQENGNGGGSYSKAWIAGTVVGGTVGLALIGFVLYWWRRIKSRQLGVAQEDGITPAPPYTAANKVPPPTELMGDHVNEMAATTAFSDEHPGKLPQELPG